MRHTKKTEGTPNRAGLNMIHCIASVTKSGRLFICGAMDGDLGIPDVGILPKGDPGKPHTIVGGHLGQSLLGCCQRAFDGDAVGIPSGLGFAVDELEGETSARINIKMEDLSSNLAGKGQGQVGFSVP